MRRLMAKNVLVGLVTAWRLAGRPTRRSSSEVNATMEGVVFAPSEFSRTFGLPPSMTATHELVVPRSIPITFPMYVNPSQLRRTRWTLLGIQRVTHEGFETPVPRIQIV